METIYRTKLLILIVLLLTPMFLMSGSLSASSSERSSTPALPSSIPTESMPENFTTDDYSNTTNPFSDAMTPDSAMDEVDDSEGNHPLYVLVFVDEEERAIQRKYARSGYPVSWSNYAKIQLERGDESLAATFGIDIRILDVLEWDSDDSLTTANGVLDELISDTRQYLRQLYFGEYWSAGVDAIVGITAQECNGDEIPIQGLATSDAEKDNGDLFTLLKWWVYWADDNLVQHETSHLYYAHGDDAHVNTCCVMAYHPHYHFVLWEDGFWWVDDYVECLYTAYTWCVNPDFNCHQIIQQNCGRYPLLTLYVYYYGGGTTNSTWGGHLYASGSSVTVTATPNPGHVFHYWVLWQYGQTTLVYSNPATVLLNIGPAILWAFFTEPVCAMKTTLDGSFPIPNLAVDILKIETLFDNSHAIGDQKGGTSPCTSIVDWPDAKVDISDVGFVSGQVGTYEGHSRWRYMSDINGDRRCDIQDLARVSANYGQHDLMYSSGLAGVVIRFNTGQEISLDPSRFVSIPSGTTSFTVYRNGNTIGALVTFHRW